MIVSDASPLICLAKVGKLYLLREIEKGVMSKGEAIKTLDKMIKDGFRFSTRIYAEFLEELKIY
jgi:predicted nucleic acid-binding protein